jgi:hypothetical protein
MPFTRTSFLRLLKIIAAIIIAGIIIGYAIWRSFNYARGPHIEIFEPANGSSTASTTLLIRGQAKRINNLTLNGMSMFINEEGDFNSRVIIFPGINRLTISGRDQFGRETSTSLEIVGKGVMPEPKVNEPEKIATSTATSTATTSTGTSIGE